MAFNLSPIQVFCFWHDIATNRTIALKVPFNLLFTLRATKALIDLLLYFLLPADFADLDLFSDLFVIVDRFHPLFDLAGVNQLKVISFFRQSDFLVCNHFKLIL
jgi:hypothetical protein